MLCEVGGTVGDIEGLPFFEAIRQFRYDVGFKHSCFVHVTLLPFLKTSGELKTKPSQHSVNTLRSIGIQPDILVCRTEHEINKGERRKLAQFTNVDPESVIECCDLKCLYEVPLALEQEGLASRVLDKLELQNTPPNLTAWREMVHAIKNPKHAIRIGLAGKYNDLSDAYLSVIESLKHASAAVDAELELQWVNSEDCEDPDTASALLQGLDGLVVPGGFGSRGIEGKINVIQYARENQLPFLGLCLGMQCAVIEYARNVAGLGRAHTIEANPKTDHPVIALMANQKNVADVGGTMRLGQYPCHLVKHTKAHKAYGSDVVMERHRHRYEVNNDYREILSNAGLIFSGLSPDSELVEMIEITDHPWFVATQFHPEFKSRPDNAHPLFIGLMKAALEKRLSRGEHGNPILAQQGVTMSDSALSTPPQRP
jgi:CTP synthase